MNLTSGLIAAVSFLGLCTGQVFIRGLRASQPTRIIRIFRHGPSSASASSSASAGSASASSSASASTSGITSLAELLGSAGIFGGHVGGRSEFDIQQLRAPVSTGFLRSQQIQRPVVHLASHPGHSVTTYPGSTGGVQLLGGGGIQSPVYFESQYEQQDPNTPDTPDLVYAPRSMMGNVRSVEALRNRAEADGVVFV